VVFDPVRLDGARRHQVKPGESLGQIAKQARREGILVDSYTLALVNRISNPNLVQAGQLLKIPVRPIKAVLEKRSFLMGIYLGDVLIRLYWVGHGAEDRTPETTFTIGAKLEHPDWYADDGKVYQYGSPKNVLGDYFVKFTHASYTGFGAHGTPDPTTIGKMASKGCIRMRDTDIREFFRIMPRGCEVEIRATE
jgi:L,D-transpeptidase catalytic domain/LysM domain